jgi:periplasmic divalent cation tolerance protein
LHLQRCPGQTGTERRSIPQEQIRVHCDAIPKDPIFTLENYFPYAGDLRHAAVHDRLHRVVGEDRMAADSEFVFIYSVFPNRAVAEKIARTLLEARLAACVNIFPPMASLYEWEGKLETGRETAAIIKTRRTLANRVIETARPLHPYTIPCFLILPVAGGNADYLDWMRAQTAP